MAPRWHQKSMPSSKDDLKKRCFSLGQTMILKVLEVEVGTKNPLKIFSKRSSTWEGLLALMFHGCWWILEAKLSQVGMENRAKIDQKAH